MNADRLLRLAALLESDAANPNGVKFDLRTWAGDAAPEPGMETEPPDPKKLGVHCGTQACAIGLACLSGAFAEDGLSWEVSDHENNIVPLFNGQKGIDAVTELFALYGHSQACRLFVDVYYPDEQQKGRDAELAVAARVREFVATGCVP